MVHPESVIREWVFYSGRSIQQTGEWATMRFAGLFVAILAILLFMVALREGKLKGSNAVFVAIIVALFSSLTTIYLGVFH